jgi:hypothetical protein
MCAWRILARRASPWQIVGHWQPSGEFSLPSAAQRSRIASRVAFANKFSTSARIDTARSDLPTYFPTSPAPIVSEAASIAAKPAPSPPRRRSRWWWVLGAGAMIWLGGKLYSSMLGFAELRALEALSVEQLQNHLALTDNALLKLEIADKAVSKDLEPFLSEYPHLERPAAFIKFYLSDVLDSVRRDDRKKIHQFVDVFLTMKRQIDVRRLLVQFTNRHNLIVAEIRRKQALSSK